MKLENELDILISSALAIILDWWHVKNTDIFKVTVLSCYDMFLLQVFCVVNSVEIESIEKQFDNYAKKWI